MGDGDCRRRKAHVSIQGREVERLKWKTELKSIDTVTDSDKSGPSPPRFSGAHSGSPLMYAILIGS